MNSQYYSRFKDLPWFKRIEKTRIMIGGAGGIGSHLTFMLSRAGAEIILIDNDRVEEHNIGGQLFGKADIGKLKVQAVSDVIDLLCGDNKVTGLNTFIDEKPGQWRDLMPSCDVVCAVFDNIKAREIMYHEWYVKTGFDHTGLFVDARMSVENGQVFIFDRDHLLVPGSKAYKEHFFDDKDVPDAQCTMKATTHCGSLIASLCVAQINNWMTNMEAFFYPTVMTRAVPLKLEFHLPVMFFKSYDLVTEEAVVNESV